MRFLEALTNILNKALMIAGGTAVLALMVLATGNVVLRVFHFPFRGAYEIVSFLGAIRSMAVLIARCGRARRPS